MIKVTCRDLGIKEDYVYRIPRFLFPIAIFYFRVMHDYIETEVE